MNAESRTYKLSMIEMFTYFKVAHKKRESRQNRSRKNVNTCREGQIREESFNTPVKYLEKTITYRKQFLVSHFKKHLNSFGSKSLVKTPDP